MSNKTEIMQRLMEHKDGIQSIGYKPVYVALQGSQNYRLDYEGSDIDTKAIVLPSLDDIVLNRKLISTTHIFENNEHCDIKDIRLMFANFKKQNINFLEVLFTDYWWADSAYHALFQQLRDIAEDIAHYNRAVAIKCMGGMAKEKHKAMEHPYPSLIDKIEKYGYDAKQLHHIVRMREFMERYLAGEPFSQCLISKSPEYLINIKKFTLSLIEARALAAVEMVKIDSLMHSANVDNVPNQEVEDKMNIILRDIIKTNISAELK